MSTATKYLLNKPPLHPVETVPERLSEQRALKILVSATGGAACPLHEVGPVTAHMAGPIAAVPPEGHPGWADLRGQTAARSSRVLDGLLLDACGLHDTNDIRCRCGVTSAHHLAVTFRHVSHGCIIRAHRNDERAQRCVDEAIRSLDVDRLIYELEPRLDALKMLVDRARAEHGGDLPEMVAEATVVLAKTLTGPTRWDLRTGYAMWGWGPGWRWSSLAEKCDWVMQQEEIHDAVICRLIEGS